METTKIYPLTPAPPPGPRMDNSRRIPPGTLLFPYQSTVLPHNPIFPHYTREYDAAASFPQLKGDKRRTKPQRSVITHYNAGKESICESILFVLQKNFAAAAAVSRRHPRPRKYRLGHRGGEAGKKSCVGVKKGVGSFSGVGV